MTGSRQLLEDLPRRETAAELSVSLNTVGTHLRRIYAKLGADDRSAAVRRARGLRLLSADLTHPSRAVLLLLQAVGKDDLVDRLDSLPTGPVALKFAG
jgi:hypothetical protein